VLEARAPEMRCQHSASVLAVERGDHSPVADLFAAFREEGLCALVVEKHTRRPANSYTGVCAQPEVDVLRRRLCWMIIWTFHLGIPYCSVVDDPRGALASDTRPCTYPGQLLLRLSYPSPLWWARFIAPRIFKLS
jgi:hypothetical protein